MSAKNLDNHNRWRSKTIICITALVFERPCREVGDIALIVLYHHFHSFRVAFGCGNDYHIRQ